MVAVNVTDWPTTEGLGDAVSVAVVGESMVSGWECAVLVYDTVAMGKEEAWLAGKPGWMNNILYLQSDTAAFGGHLALARELTRRAAGSAERDDRRETAAAYVAEGAVREALVGNLSLATQQARASLAMANDTDVKAMSAVALGLTGETQQAALLAAELNNRFQKVRSCRVTSCQRSAQQP